GEAAQAGGGEGLPPRRDRARAMPLRSGSHRSAHEACGRGHRDPRREARLRGQCRAKLKSSVSAKLSADEVRGTIRTAAGNWNGDIVVGPDGSLYIADACGGIRRVSV